MGLVSSYGDVGGGGRVGIGVGVVVGMLLVVN